eukprot:4980621-Prymnesium_polylepis.1
MAEEASAITAQGGTTTVDDRSPIFEAELEPVPDKPGEAPQTPRKLSVSWNAEPVSLEAAVKA